MKIVVGIDPGTTSAVCALDLEKELVFCKSKRGAGSKEIIRWITDKGSPVLICCDVCPCPETVKKIASSFSAQTFVPEDDLSTDKKKELAEEYGFENDHERDALAAAVNGFNAFESKLRKAKKLFEKNREEVWSAAFEDVKLKEAVKQAKEPEKKEKKEEKKKKPVRKTSEIEKRLRRKNRRLKKKVSDLESYVNKLKKKNRELQEKEPEQRTESEVVSKKEKEIKRLKKRVKLREKEISELEKKLNEVGEILEKVSGGELELKKEPDEYHEIVEEFGKYYVVKEKEREKRLTVNDLKNMIKGKK